VDENEGLGIIGSHSRRTKAVQEAPKTQEACSISHFQADAGDPRNCHGGIGTVFDSLLRGAASPLSRSGQRTAHSALCMVLQEKVEGAWSLKE